MLEKKDKMSLEERCELQKTAKQALNEDIMIEDKLMCQGIVDKFENDIFNIASRVKENSLQKAATLQIALNRLTDELNKI
nr:MAG TPA: hypothetical protein [Caudoviricetes sp.]